MNRPDRNAIGSGLTLVLLFVAVALLAAQQPAVKFDEPLPVPQVTPGAAQIEVALAANRAAGLVHVVWVEDDKKAREIYHATLDLKTNQFAAPSKVRDTKGALLRGVQARVDLNGEVYIAWAESASQLESAILMRSTSDGGKAFTRPSVKVSDNPGQKPVGLPALAVENGRVYVSWLDGRNYQNLNQGADLHFRASLNGRDFDKSTAVFTQVNECPSAIALAPQMVIVLFRLGPGPAPNDIALRASRDAGNSLAPPMRVSDDGWKNNRAADSGPQAVFDKRDRLHVVWTLGKESPGDVYYAHSVFESNRTMFTPKKRVHTAVRGAQLAPALALDESDRIFVAWQDDKDKLFRVHLAYSTDEGKNFSETTPVKLVNPGAQQTGAVLSALGDNSLWLGWTETLPTTKATSAYLARVQPLSQPPGASAPGAN